MPVDDDPYDRAIINAIADRLSNSDEAISAAWLRKLFADNHRKIDDQAALVIDDQPSDAAIERWIRCNPQWFKQWVERYNRVAGIHNSKIT